MSNENGTPGDKKLRYLGLIIAIVAIVVAIILAIWGNPPPPPDFSISINPMQGAVHQGATITTDVTIKGVSGYEEQVGLSATGQPYGIVLAFAPQSAEAKPSYTSKVMITVNSKVPTGDYRITIKGTGADGKERKCIYTLTVKPSVTPTPTPTSTKVFPLLDIINATQLAKIDEEACVTVLIHNRGNGTAKNITLKESIPSSISVSSVDGASSSSGNLVIWRGELKPDEMHLINHTFKILEEKKIFFQAKATFKDEYDKRYETSATIFVMAKGPTPTADLEETFTNTIGMELVLIPAGEFEMGSQSDEQGAYSDEGPVHHVNLKNAFYMGKYEVTQRQWRTIMGDKPSWFTGDDSLPVELVSWNDVQEFIKKLNEKEGTNKYRLPSEVEWEYACRAGTTTRYSFGDSESELGDYAWYDDNSDDKTHTVGQKKSNSWGLYDMHGNVWEWVEDSWHDRYNGAPADGSAWEGDSACRVFRGGSWRSSAGFCRSANRNHYSPDYSRGSLGFRILKEQ